MVPVWVVMAYVFLSIRRQNRADAADRKRAEEEDAAIRRIREEHAARVDEARRAVDQVRASILRAMVEAENGGKVPQGEN